MHGLVHGWCMVVVVVVVMFLGLLFINFIEGLFPLAIEAHCGYTSLNEYVITYPVSTRDFEVRSLNLSIAKKFGVEFLKSR